MRSVKQFFAELLEKIRKMTPKQIVCTVMCVLLITVIVLTCIVIGKVSRIFNSLNSTPETSAPTETTQPPEPSTTVPTVPTVPSTTFPTDPDHVHDFVLTESVEASCMNYGYNIYTCSCGKQDIPLDEQTPPLDHSYGAGQVIAPTCTEDGYTKHTCSRCGDVVTSNTVPATGHDYVLTEEVEGTCGVQAHTISVCSICGDELTEYTGELLEHEFELVEEKTVSCTEDGYTLSKCVNCGEEKKENIQTATGHSFSAWAKLPDGTWIRACLHEGCDLQETSADLKIRKDQSGTVPDSSGNPYKLYMIYVGTETAPDLFLYTINDFLDNGTLNYTYDPAQGLIITYTTSAGPQIIVQPILQSSEVTIVADEKLPENTTPPTTEPVEPTLPSEPVESRPAASDPEEAVVGTDPVDSTNPPEGSSSGETPE